MKAMRRILAAAMTLSLTACLTYPAFAATYDVSDASQVQTAVTNHVSNEDGDTSVILNMTNDIGDVGTVTTQEKWTYTFQGNGHTLGALNAAGAGTVVVNGDMKSGEKVLMAQDTVNVTVNGNVEYEGQSFGGIAVRAEGNSSVTVNGNVKSGGIGVFAKGDSSVNVSKDIDAQFGIVTTDNSEAVVEGNITSTDDSCRVEDNSKLTVNGNIDSQAGYGLAVKVGNDESACVQINGNINSGTYAAYVDALDNGNAEITVNGNVNSSKDIEAIRIGAFDNSSVNYTQNGSVTSSSMGFDIYSGNNASVEAEINGNVTSEIYSYVGAQDSASSSLTVNGDSSVKDGDYYGAAYVVQSYDSDPDCSVQLEHNGDISISGEEADCIYIEGAYARGTVDVVVNGNLNRPNPEKGIGVNVYSLDPAVNITVAGEKEVPVHGVHGYLGGPNLHITQRIAVTSQQTLPAKRIPVSFQSETLEGEQVESGEASMLLVYFDPADLQSVSQLQKGQEAFQNGGTVYAVCLTEDYEAAKAAMEEAGAKYPILKNNESLQKVLTLSGRTDPVGLMIEEGTLVIPGYTTGTTTYSEIHPQFIPDKEVC